MLIWQEADGSLTTPIIPLTSEHITEDGIFLLENGEDALTYIGDRVNSYILDQLFGISLTRFSPQVFSTSRFGSFYYLVWFIHYSPLFYLNFIARIGAY